MTAGVPPASRLLLDTNVLVLFAVGTVNRQRIGNFKRTRQYTISDFDLLIRTLGQWRSLYTVPHVLAEVSNLTDLGGAERLQVRHVLKETIAILTEIMMPSSEAALEPTFLTLGLVDASIAAVARQHQCAVLTDDLDLFLQLQRDGRTVYNFTHLRARQMDS